MGSCTPLIKRLYSQTAYKLTIIEKLPCTSMSGSSCCASSSRVVNALSVSILALSCWDPGLFQLVSDRLLDLVDETDSQVIDRLATSLPNIAERFYHVPGCDDTLFSLAGIYYALGDYQEAVDLYEMSNIYFPDDYETLFNIGLCYYYQEEYEPAIEFLEEALKLNSSSNDCRAQIQRAKRKRIL
jgi:tetratricopeptide (TPR) repeat protein